MVFRRYARPEYHSGVHFFENKKVKVRVCFKISFFEECEAAKTSNRWQAEITQKPESQSKRPMAGRTFFRLAQLFLTT
jgi:hypothetical protein